MGTFVWDFSYHIGTFWNRCHGFSVITNGTLEPKLHFQNSLSALKFGVRGDFLKCNLVISHLIVL